MNQQQKETSANATPTPNAYYYPQYQPSRVVQDARELAKKKNGSLMFVLTFVFSILFVDLVLRGGYGYSIPIITLLSWAVFIPIIMAKGKKTSTAAFVMLIPIGVLAVCFGYYSTAPVKFISVLVMIVLTILQYAKLSGISQAGFFTWSNFVHGLHNVFVLPFECIGSAFSSLGSKKEKAGTKKGGAGTKILVGVLVSVPAVVLLLCIFSATDDVFKYYVQHFLDMIDINILDILFDVILGVLISLYLFPYFFGLRSGTVLEEKEHKAGKGIDGAYVASFLGMCTLAYLGFVAVQFNYLFNKSLPANMNINMNFAEYARKGFGEMCFIIALTFLVIVLALSLTRKRESGRLPVYIKVILTVLAASDIIFVASALARMLWYTNEYGLTRNRVMGSWFIVVLGICTLGVILRIWFDKLKLSFALGIIVVVMTIGLNLMNVDGMVARHNVDRYLKTGKIDISYFTRLSPASVPELERLIGTDREDDAKAIMKLYYEKMNEKRYGGWTMQEVLAYDRIQKVGAHNLNYNECYKLVYGYTDWIY